MDSLWGSRLLGRLRTGTQGCTLNPPDKTPEGSRESAFLRPGDEGVCSGGRQVEVVRGMEQLETEGFLLMEPTVRVAEGPPVHTVGPNDSANVAFKRPEKPSVLWEMRFSCTQNLSGVSSTPSLELLLPPTPQPRRGLWSAPGSLHRAQREQGAVGRPCTPPTQPILSTCSRIPAAGALRARACACGHVHVWVRVCVRLGVQHIKLLQNTNRLSYVKQFPAHPGHRRR